MFTTWNTVDPLLDGHPPSLLSGMVSKSRNCCCEIPLIKSVYTVTAVTVK